MKLSLLLLLIAYSQIGFSQDNSFQKKIEKLPQIKEMPYAPELSGDSIYWVIVKEGLKVIPYLIERLSDTTITEATVPIFGGYYTVADIANRAIYDIIREIPTLDFVVNSNNPAGGYWYYWDYVRGGYNNRLMFQAKVKLWFEQNKINLVWKEDNGIYRADKDWKFKSLKHPAGGYYVLKRD